MTWSFADFYLLFNNVNSSKFNWTLFLKCFLIEQSSYTVHFDSCDSLAENNTWESSEKKTHNERVLTFCISPSLDSTLCLKEATIYINGSNSYPTNNVNRAIFSKSKFSLSQVNEREAVSRAVPRIVFVFVVFIFCTHWRERRIYMGVVSTKRWMNWGIGMECMWPWMLSLSLYTITLTHMLVNRLWFREYIERKCLLIGDYLALSNAIMHQTPIFTI